MCGIVGLVRAGGGDVRAPLERALARIAHRGPDDAGIWRVEVGGESARHAIGLGHARLSIQDPGPRGHQPMQDGQGRVIVFNGEIYNFPELRAELERHGYRFATRGDTEVILAAYAHWGEDCLEHFNGMWALAIWDGRGLFLARDRLGEKPLYLYHDRARGMFCFSSEIKAMRAFPAALRPDGETVYRFLAFGEMERDGRTFFEDVRELPPGACLSFRPGDREPRVRRYWRLRDGIIDVDEREAVDTTHRLLHDSLSIRLRSDVPLGLSLSGGLDSTLLLALLNQAGYKDIPAFSSGYRESGYNETRYIDMARRSLACRPWSTAPTWRDFAADFERLIYHLDQPCKLPGPYSQWAVAKLAKDHVKVLLDGQGADELAGGYLYFLPQAWREAGLLQRLRHFPGLIATLLGNRHLLRQYAPGLIWERVRGRARAPGGGVPLRGRWAAAHARLRPFWEGDVGGLQAALRRSVTDTSLPPLLRYGDRVNMAFGIENRCPFLDHRLVEYVASLPVEMKIRGGVTKWIFRAVAEGRVPGGIAGRRMKMGFPTPVGVWLRTALAEQAECWLREYAGQPYFRLWLDVEGARRVLARHVAGAGEHQALLWRILAIGAWEKSAGLS